MGIRSNISSAVKRVLGFGRNANPLKNLRAYQGALVSRLTSDWMSSQLSADAEIRNSLRKLRDRSRELVRNNPYARQAKRTTQINIVGTGMKFQSLVVQQRGGKRDQRVNNIIEEAWSEWTQADSCDCAGKYSFHQFEWLALLVHYVSQVKQFLELLENHLAIHKCHLLYK